MDAATRELVRRRAQGRCEYRRLPQAAQPFVNFHIEHIIARKHGGADKHDNLCVACERCNSHKGPNLTGIDPDSGHVVRLFDPPHQDWNDHLGFLGPVIAGLTAVGRTTVEVLKMNENRRVQLRADLIAGNEL